MTRLRAVLLTITAGLSVGLAYVIRHSGQRPPAARAIVEAAALVDDGSLAGAAQPQEETAVEAELLSAPAKAAPDEQPLTLGRLAVIPRPAKRTVNIVVAGVTPQYAGPRQRLAENFRGLTDTLLLVQLDAGAKAVRVVSFPRDTKIARPGGGFTKLNSVLPTQGPDGLSRVIAGFSGVSVDAYLLLGLEASRQLTDALGGVNILVPKNMYYDDHAAGLHIRLNQGQQRLNGEQAEGFIRFRHDALGDIGRVQRQQAFMRAALSEVLTPSGLTRIPALGAVLERNTRSNITPEGLGAAFDLLRQRPSLESFTLPGSLENSGGASYWVADRNKAAALFTRHFLGSGTGLPLASAAALDVAIVDAGAGPQAAARTRDLLRERGYARVRLASRTGSGAGKTTILGQQGLADLEQVRGALGYGEARLSGEGVLGADITVWLGNEAR